MKKYLSIFPLILALVLFQGCGGDKTTDGDSDTGETDNSKFPAQDVTAEMEAYYKEKSDFFKFKTIEDLPADLEWTDNSQLPEVGSPKAKKGGTTNSRLQDYPDTLRIVGPNSNGSFRNYLLDDVTVNLAHRHPETLEFFPGLAQEWAIDKENKTVYVKIDPKATWSDGKPVTTDDFFFMFFFFQSKYIQAPWYNNWYGTQYTGITKFDDHTLAISVPEAKPDMDSRVLELGPKPAHFYKELGDDFPQRYQWRFQPTTAAYVVKDSDVKKGRTIALSRLENWWAKDKKHWRYRFNPDRIEFKVIRDTAKAFEEFKAGNLDGFGLDPDYWYNKLPNDHPIVKDGYVKKVTFYNDRPRPTYALWINQSKHLLSNKDIRIGINYATNWERVIEKYFRNDYTRMKTSSDGFASFSHPTLTARPFDIKKAGEHFAKAGFDKRDRDGILVNEAGERLSFTLSTGYESLKDMLPILKQEAKKAGLELKMEVLDGTSGFKKTLEKNHEIAFSAFGTFVEMYPRYWESWHGDNAYDVDENGKKTVKTQTNNFTQTSLPELDELIIKYRKSEDADEMRQLAYKMEEIIHDEAAYVPGFVQPFYRVGLWRWMQYPDDFNVKISSGPGEWFVGWIDEDMKKETLEARKAGKTFPTSIEVYDQYKID
ncbi:MAG: extracellular solute-binding protein [Verrucomicrobiales bacterium]|nr:extracellular solute-binding protein [Verrucomicrobiales bacterium]